MYSFLAMADVLVSPREEGSNFPLKVFDYLAAGKPIVATDWPAHRQVLNEERALLVEPSGDAIAVAIVRLLRDPDMAARLGAAGKAYAEEELAWSAFSEMVAALYDSVRGMR